MASHRNDEQRIVVRSAAGCELWSHVSERNAMWVKFVLRNPADAFGTTRTTNDDW